MIGTWLRFKKPAEHLASATNALFQARERRRRTHGKSHNVTHVVEASMPSIGGGKLFTWRDV